MKLRSLAGLGIILVAVIISGCSRRGVAEPVDRPGVNQATGSNSEPAPAQQHPSTPNAQGAAPATQVDLTLRLLSFPSPQAQPQFHWPLQPKDTRFHPLPNGFLLVWTESLTSDDNHGLFSVSALNAEGQPVWIYRLHRPIADVQFIGVSPSGQRVAFMEPDGNVHVLSTSDGQVIATVHVVLGPDTNAVQFIADGQFLAVQRSTPSGVVPQTLAVYSVATGSKVAYATEGIRVQSSPYHDMILGLQALDKRGIEVTAATGAVGFIRYEYQVQAEQVSLASSADGQLIYVVSRDKGLDVYGRNLKPRFHREASPSLDAELAPVSKVIWHDASPGVVQLIDAQGKVTTVTFDKVKIVSGRVMPGGEKVFQVGPPNQKVDCVVKSSGDVFGCFPFVSFDSTTAGDHSFFWARLQDGTIAAYKP